MSRWSLVVPLVMLERRGVRDAFGRSSQLVTGRPEGKIAALLCVERDPEACHRSLIAERLVREYGAQATHLRP